jgi:cyanate lyase
VQNAAGHEDEGAFLQRTGGRGRPFPLYRHSRSARADVIAEGAARAAAALEMPEAQDFLTEIPLRGSLGRDIPTDPLIYRFYEIVQVYGTTLKALIQEEFGDGIMSAIDFDLDLTRQPDPNGDRVKIVMTGKFLKYKKD